MFNFRTVTTLFFIFLLGMNLLMLLGYSISWMAYLFLFAGYLGISIGASFFMETNFHMISLTKGATREPLLSLTFDDGPDPVMTPKVLDILKEHDCKATFFLIGKNLAGNEAVVQRIHEEGHWIGTHSFSHAPMLDFYPPKIIRKELMDSSDAVLKIIGRKPKMFRPPYGVINPLVKKALHGLNYHVIGFSNRLFDTVTKDPEKILERFAKQLSPGDIVLFHDRNADIEIILKNILNEIQQRNFKVVPLDQLLNIQPYD
ncbi:MAG: polysaccharide deacetylase family protein [Syntrophothermus sp.]